MKTTSPLSQRCPRVLFAGVCAVFVTASVQAAAPPAPRVVDTPYVILACNDLGMHCMNSDFSEMMVLPPFNTLHAQIIRRSGENIAALEVDTVLVKHPAVAHVAVIAAPGVSTVSFRRIRALLTAISTTPISRYAHARRNMRASFALFRCWTTRSQRCGPLQPCGCPMIASHGWWMMKTRAFAWRLLRGLRARN